MPQPLWLCSCVAWMMSIYRCHQIGSDWMLRRLRWYGSVDLRCWRKWTRHHYVLELIYSRLTLFLILASSSTRIWRRNTLMASSVVAFINFDSYGSYADHWRSMQHMYWYMHSFTVESTTATPSSMESATGLSESCNQYCMLLPVWWLVSVGTSISRRPFVMTICTSYQSSSGSHTRLQRWRSVVFVVRARLISLTSVRQFRQLHSAHHGRLILPATKSKTFGSRNFRSAAPTVWNSLPTNLLDINIGRGQFGSGFKIWLFGCAYT